MNNPSDPPDDPSSVRQRKARLLSRRHALDVNGNVWAIDIASGLLIAPPLYNVNGVPDDYRNLLAAAPMGFNVIEDTLRFHDTLTAALEERGLDDLVGSLLDASGGLHTMQKASLVGLDKIKR